MQISNTHVTQKKNEVKIDFTDPIKDIFWYVKFKSIDNKIILNIVIMMKR